jgi:hypothetical protein
MRVRAIFSSIPRAFFRSDRQRCKSGLELNLNVGMIVKPYQYPSLITLSCPQLSFNIFDSNEEPVHFRNVIDVSVSSCASAYFSNSAPSSSTDIFENDFFMALDFLRPAV